MTEIGAQLHRIIIGSVFIAPIDKAEDAIHTRAVFQLCKVYGFAVWRKCIDHSRCFPFPYNQTMDMKSFPFREIHSKASSLFRHHLNFEIIESMRNSLDI